MYISAEIRISFYELYGRLIPGCLLILFGVIILIIGVVLYLRYKNVKNKKPIKATVVSCEIGNYVDIDYRDQPQCFHVTFKFFTKYGPQIVTIIRQGPMDVGATVEVLYNHKTGDLDMAYEVKKYNGALGKVFITIGIVWMLISIGATVGSFFGNIPISFKPIIGMLIGMLFFMVGLYASIILPVANKKNMRYCDIVEGEIVDFIKNGSTAKESIRDRTHTSYAAIYEYEYGGRKSRIRSSGSSTTGEYTELGKKVSIVVNHKTGEVYCIEDKKNLTGMGIVFIIFGIAIVGIMIVLIAKGSSAYYFM